jgi:hypothetical protein
MLLIEGTLTLLLLHGNRRYAAIAADAAKRLLRPQSAGLSRSR